MNMYLKKSRFQVAMRLILLPLVMLFATSYSLKSQEIQELEKEITKDLEVNVIKRLNDLAAEGKKYPKKEAAEVLMKITTEETKNLKRKLSKLVRLIRGTPSLNENFEKVYIHVKASKVKQAYWAIIKIEGDELSGRAEMINHDLEAASRAATDLVNRMLSEFRTT